MWILSCTAPVGYLSRMTQWKVRDDGSKTYNHNLSIVTDHRQSKLALSDEVSALDSTSVKAKLRLGLFSYPVLQAADILLYGYSSILNYAFIWLTCSARLMFQ